MFGNKSTNRDHHSPGTTPISLTYTVGACSHQSKRRKSNADSIFAARSTWGRKSKQLSVGLFVVADGLGAYADGHDASSGAIQAMADWILQAIPSAIKRTRCGIHTTKTALDSQSCSALLTEAVQQANEAVYQQNVELQKRWKDEDVGVSTAITVAMIVDTTVYVANVGNSRTYLYRAGEGLKKITNDHSVVARMVASGIIEPDDIYTSLYRNQVYRILGDTPTVEVDSFSVSLQIGDKLLLCSYGLWDVVRDSQLEDTISQKDADPADTASALIQAAIDNGDCWEDASVIVVSLSEAQGQQLTHGTHIFVRSENVSIPEI